MEAIASNNNFSARLQHASEVMDWAAGYATSAVAQILLEDALRGEHLTAGRRVAARSLGGAWSELGV